MYLFNSNPFLYKKKKKKKVKLGLIVMVIHDISDVLLSIARV
jgi:hypothetical protein